MRSHWGAFAALCLGSAIVAWHPLIATLRLSATNDEYTHILLILPISIALIWTQRRRLYAVARPSIGYYVAILGAAALLLAISSRVWLSRTTPDVQLSAQMLALVIWWIGSFLLCFGSSASRVLMFPLGFLLWMVPFPGYVLNQVIQYLQEGSAASAKVLFAAAGVPLSQNGLLLSIPGLTIEIAKECSSIRSSLMLLVTTMVLAQVFLRSNWRKLGVVALALPLSVAKNGLRIFTIAMLGTRVDPGFLEGRLHHNGGIVFFALALALIFGVLLVLERGEKRALEGPALKPAAV